MHAKRARGATTTVDPNAWATDALPKQWASATIPPRAAPKFWAILAAPNAAMAAALRFKHDLHFFLALELLGHGKTHTVKSARNSGFLQLHGAWLKGTVPTPQLARLVGKRVGRRG